MGRVGIAELRSGINVKQLSTNKVGIVTDPPTGRSAEDGNVWVDFGGGPEPIREDDIDIALRGVRLTVRHNPADPEDDLKLVAKLQRDLWAHSPVTVDPENPASQTRRDENRNAYFEFATEYSAEVRKVLRNFGYDGRVEMQDLGEVGLVCTRCGFLSGFVTVCPNCKQRDISRCPNCQHEIAREHYTPVGGDLFVCPNCQHRLRMQFNELGKDTRSLSEAVVLVTDA